jgi:hypothetical protein
MSDISNLIDATKVVNESLPDKEELIQDKLKILRNIDLAQEALKQENVDSLTKTLNVEEKKKFNLDVENMAESYSGILDTIADCLEDPENRMKIIDELKRRMG